MKRNTINSQKNNLKIRVYFFTLMSLFTANFTLKIQGISLEQEKELCVFIEKFFNKDIEPNKPFEAWLDDLKNLLKGSPNFNQYCVAISNIEKARNAIDAGKNFEKFQNLIPDNVKNFFKSRYSKAVILKNLNERLKKRSGNAK